MEKNSQKHSVNSQDTYHYLDQLTGSGHLCEFPTDLLDDDNNDSREDNTLTYSAG